MPSFCRLEVHTIVDLWPNKDTVSFLMKSFFKPSFIMLYTRDFVLRYYVWFLQIRSQIL